MKKIEIFGTGCSKCNRLEKNVKAAVKELHAKAVVEKVDDLNEIASRGIPITPALVVDGNLVAAGRVPDIDEIKEILEEYQ
jgi:small redox-active disulfide protein 2